MRLNQKTIPHKKLIKVKKNWLIVPLISIVMNSSSLVHASDVNAQHVKDSEGFLSALTNKDVHSIYLERDIKLKDRSLINKLPRRNLLINLSNHRLDWGNNEWQFTDDDWEELAQIKVQFVNGYLNMDEVDQIKKAYDDVNSQIDIELDHINKTPLENHIDVDEGIWGEQFENPSDIPTSDYQDKSSVASLDDKNMIENWSSNALASSSSVDIQNNDSQSSVSSGYIDKNSQNDKFESNDAHTDASQPSSSAVSFSSESPSMNSSSAPISKSDSAITSLPSSSFVSNSKLNSSASVNFDNSNGISANSSSSSNSIQSLNSSGNSAVISNSANLPNRNSDKSSLASSASNSDQSLDSSGNGAIISNSVTSSNHAGNSSLSTSSVQNNNELQLNNHGLLDYLNLIPSLKPNRSIDHYSKGDFYQSLSKILQSLTTSQNDLKHRVKNLEDNPDRSQSKITTVENDRTEPFTVASHRIKIKQKCYVYQNSTFDVNQRIRLATNEELADQSIEKHAYSKYGRLRYKVKDGYITANPDFVQKIS